MLGAVLLTSFKQVANKGSFYAITCNTQLNLSFDKQTLVPPVNGWNKTVGLIYYLNDLACFYQETNQTIRALVIYHGLLLGLKSNYEHAPLFVASLLNNMALIYIKQRHYNKAISLLRRALDIDSKHALVHSPSSAGTLNNLAKVYELTGQYLKALTLYNQALTILENFLGVNHAETAKVRENYERLLLISFNDKLLD